MKQNRSIDLEVTLRFYISLFLFILGIVYFILGSIPVLAGIFIGIGIYKFFDIFTFVDYKYKEEIKKNQIISELCKQVINSSKTNYRVATCIHRELLSGKVKGDLLSRMCSYYEELCESLIDISDSMKQLDKKKNEK